MTRDEHLKLYEEHWDKMRVASKRFRESLNLKDFEESKKEYHLANKHYGIARMMQTKEMQKILREAVR